MAESNAFTDWAPRDYLRDYYTEVEPDEVQTMQFLVDQMRGATKGPVLCFGCGPTLHHVFLATPYASELCLADYLAGNLDEIDAWRREAPGAHDWTDFVRYTLRCESNVEPSDEQIAARTRATRQAIQQLARTDAGLKDPLGEGLRGHFATVLSPFCADSATDDKAVWARYSRNIASLVRPGGLFLTTALRCCHRYKVGNRYFPAANIDEGDLRAVLEQDFPIESIKVDVREVPKHAEQGYTAVLLARAVKAT